MILFVSLNAEASATIQTEAALFKLRWIQHYITSFGMPLIIGHLIDDVVTFNFMV